MSFTIKILEQPWKIEFLTPRKYARKWGNDSAGITDTSKKTIDFIEDFTDLETIRHELAHAYAVQMSAVELQLDDDQVEELFCEMIGKYALTIVQQAEHIHGEFIRAKRKGDKRKGK